MRNGLFDQLRGSAFHPDVTKVDDSVINLQLRKERAGFLFPAQTTVMLKALDAFLVVIIPSDDVEVIARVEAAEEISPFIARIARGSTRGAKD